jgi:hypothetical protein
MLDPVTRLERLDALRDRLAAMHARVAMVFFMPKTTERFQQRLYRKWQAVGRDRAMLMGSILASPVLKAELIRRRATPAQQQELQPHVKAQERPDNAVEKALEDLALAEVKAVKRKTIKM